MNIADINAELIKRHPHYRALDVRQVEEMRNAIPTYAGKAQMAEQQLAKHQAKIDRVTAVMAQFRANGQYDVSDAIRKALDGTQ